MGESGHYLFYHQRGPGQKPYLQRTDPETEAADRTRKTAKGQADIEARQIVMPVLKFVRRFSDDRLSHQFRMIKRVKHNGS